MHEHSWACWKGNLLKIMNMNDKSSQTFYPEIFGISSVLSGPYTGGVRGGSDEPPFFGQVACTRYKIATYMLLYSTRLKLATVPLSKI